MNSDVSVISGSISVIVGILAVVLAVLWILLPFAVFGIKGRLDEQKRQLQKLIGLVEQNNDLLRSATRATELPVRNDLPPQ